MDSATKTFVEALLSLDRVTATKLITEHQGCPQPIEYIENVVVKALEYIGNEWLQGKVALSQVYMAGRLCEQAVDIVLPPEAPDRKNQPAMVICTLNDHHNLGKSIVYSLLRASGFELKDLGTIGCDDLVKEAQRYDFSIILISVLMLPSALKVAEVKNLLEERGINAKVIVGGAPFRLDSELWKEVGADAMCSQASDAPAVIEKLMRGCQ